MAREAPEVRLVRETLEQVLLPSTASAVFFEALQAQGCAPPTNADECLALIRGSLHASIAERLGDAEASSIVGQLDMMLSHLASQNEKRPRRSASRHDMPTAAIHVSDDTRPIFVLSATRDFVDQLRAALGPTAVTALFVPDEKTLIARLQMLSPALIVIDAVSLPPLEPEVLVDHLRPVPNQVMKVVWGTDVAYGQRLLDAAERNGVSLTPFDRAEGVDPLLDVIRSRSPSS